jgi:hypothetical protein
LCASLYGHPVPGRSCCAWSLMRRTARPAYPRRVEPRRRTEAAQAATPATAHTTIVPPTPQAHTGQPSRPPGRQHRETTPGVLRPARPRLHTMMQPPRAVINGVMPVCQTVCDGHVGHHPALPRGRRVGVPLSAKGRHEAARYVPDDGPSAGRGPPRTSGSQLASIPLCRTCSGAPGKTPAQRTLSRPRWGTTSVRIPCRWSA